MNFLTTETAGLVVVLIGLVEVVKRIGVSSRYLPLCAILMGIGGSVALNGVSTIGVIGGIVAGLLSVGLFNSTRSTVQG